MLRTRKTKSREKRKDIFHKDATTEAQIKNKRNPAWLPETGQNKRACAAVQRIRPEAERRTYSNSRGTLVMPGTPHAEW